MHITVRKIHPLAYIIKFLEITKQNEQKILTDSHRPPKHRQIYKHFKGTKPHCSPRKNKVKHNGVFLRDGCNQRRWPCQALVSMWTETTVTFGKKLKDSVHLHTHKHTCMCTPAHWNIFTHMCAPAHSQAPAHTQTCAHTNQKLKSHKNFGKQFLFCFILI